MKTLKHPLLYGIIICLGLAIAVQAVQLRYKSQILQKQVAGIRQSIPSAMLPTYANPADNLAAAPAAQLQKAIEQLKETKALNFMALCALLGLLVLGVGLHLKTVIDFFRDMREYARTPEYYN
ncbi:MAG: hypothetical protein EAY75_09375 [Bacteroidetes bacterium]|nr:MAG: hypothetical protein EAY75_09375 [Bacteroidota bacterium]